MSTGLPPLQLSVAVSQSRNSLPKEARRAELPADRRGQSFQVSGHQLKSQETASLPWVSRQGNKSQSTQHWKRKLLLCERWLYIWCTHLHPFPAAARNHWLIMKACVASNSMLERIVCSYQLSAWSLLILDGFLVQPVKHQCCNSRAFLFHKHWQQWWKATRFAHRMQDLGLKLRKWDTADLRQWS